MEDKNLNNNRVEILIVEDSPTQAEELKYSLERHNFTVSVACNGIEALSRIRAHKPSIVISDIVMPDMDGYQLCREIKQDDRFKDLPVILLTSLSNPQDVIKGLECGADNFLTKPYDEKYTISRIQYILANKNLKDIEQTQLGVDIVLNNERYFIKSDRIQILNLLLSSYEAAIQKNSQLIRTQKELKTLNEQLEQKVNSRTAALTEEIAERKLAEEAIRKGKEEWERTFDAITDPIMILDAGYRIVKTNKSMADKLRMTPSEIAEVTCCCAVHGTKEPPAYCPHSKLLADGLPHSAEINELRFGGNFFVAVSPIFDLGGKLSGSVHYFRDITQQKILESQLIQSQKMEATGQLAGGLAHDFNNILTAIIGFSTIIEINMDNDDPNKVNVDHILVAAERAASLTKSLLAFSRKQIINLQLVDLNQVINKVVKFLKSIIGEDIDLKVQSCPDALTVNADNGQIEQVLMNLATNARDAMPKGGLLSVETKTVKIDAEYIDTHGYGEPGCYAVISVSDTGEGMAETICKKVFEPFFTTKEVGKGTGLGLSMAYGIIKQHNGFIDVYSELGRGTTFKIYLPLIRSAHAKYQISKEEILEGGKETILVVDDDASLRQLSEKFLGMFGYTIITAVDGLDALVQFRENRNRIDLVIMDVIMPKMNGEDAFNEMKKINPAVKVIFISGYTGDIIHKRGMLDQSLFFVSKPLNPKKLLSKVREVLGAINQTAVKSHRDYRKHTASKA